MYYHFDYHGGPRSYEWVNTTPLEKVWEQMSMAYDYGVRDIWIVNVGDLKPVVKMQVYAGLNNLYYESKSILANDYSALVKECIEIDNAMQNFYNKNLSNGKWNGMMSSPHIGYTYWNPDGWTYPEVKNVIPKEGSYLIVNVEGREKGFCSGTTSLQ